MRVDTLIGIDSNKSETSKCFLGVRKSAVSGSLPRRRFSVVDQSEHFTAKPSLKKWVFVRTLFGGPEGIRTLDLSDANRTLSQLSYKPGYGKMGWNKLVPPHHYTHFCGKCKCFIPLSAALPSRRRSGGTGPRAHPRPLRCAAPSSSVRTWRPERPPQPPSPGRLRSVSPGTR